MKNVIRIIKYGLLLAVLVMLGMAGWRAYQLRQEIQAQQSAQTTETADSGEQAAVPTAAFPDFLRQENADLAAWLTVPGTEVDYPVMLTPDDMESYMHRDFRGNYSACDTPFFDTRCAPLTSADSLLVYGHNMRDGTMFSSLGRYTDAAFGQAHDTLTLLLPEGTRTYRLFAVVRLSTDSDADWALCTTGVQPEYGQQLLILSTCAYHTHNGRLLVIGCEVQ